MTSQCLFKRHTCTGIIQRNLAVVTVQCSVKMSGVAPCIDIQDQALPWIGSARRRQQMIVARGKETGNESHLVLGLSLRRALDSCPYDLKMCFSIKIMEMIDIKIKIAQLFM